MLGQQLVSLAEADKQSMEILSPIQKLDDKYLKLVFIRLSPEERLKIELGIIIYIQNYKYFSKQLFIVYINFLFCFLYIVCKKWRSVNRSTVWRVKGLYYPYVDPDWEERKITHPSTYFWCKKSLLEFKLKFTYVPRLLALFRPYVQELDLSALTNTIILTKLKKYPFPNLIKLKLRINYKWQPKHCDNVFDKMKKLECLHVTTDYRQRIPINFIIAISAVANTLKELSVINFTYHQYSKEKNMSGEFALKNPEVYSPVCILLLSEHVLYSITDG